MTRPPNDDLPTLSALRGELRAAAEREMRPAGRRRRRRILLALLGAGALAASGATAAELIGVGEPAGDPAPIGRDARPLGPGVIAVVARDPEADVRWAVRIASNPRGARCAMAGQLRRQELVEADAAGRLRRIPSDRFGICGAPSRPLVFTTLTPRGPLSRTLVFGRARAGATRVRVRSGEDVDVLRVGRGGAFLAVYDGRVDPRKISLTIGP